MGSEEGQTRSGVKKRRSKSIRESRSGVARGKQKEARRINLTSQRVASAFLVSRVNFTPSVRYNAKLAAPRSFLFCFFCNLRIVFFSNL